ncbi:response regulator with CheY-like receiver domain protein and winged-helix DNA-binding domain protein [Cryptobacterium curtum DSM 15641]|uniref:Response regulator with CheY-like receiver domain protein and winged-helix DNA-binding domain protein n=1 Tax=Cryptobacterium curtum (strain ATCC 700683 / DSM 15641 / CCUG 43107 / 12-3) TaxID=469378 RepID=C7MMJ5_CRYCD|nr:response regulator transcription factor [Cryptobacterium curtum]ACU94135.1 response regulator with CheY-like receiver domain protein and winged-helix DNA-binding domain protein [Cryptobacterium curtum DSM 15641]
MARLLVVDDESAITDLLQRILVRDGYSVDAFNDPTAVLSCDLSRYDLIICDVMMPEIDGFELVERIRDHVDAPILFLTAKVGESDAVQGLAIGADDYIRKPFGTAELRAKVAAHLRRENRVYTHAFTLGAVRFDMGARELFVNDALVALTPTEYAICEYLAQHPGQVFSRQQIRKQVLGWASDAGDDAISMHVSNARTKLKRAGATSIETVWGTGYKWHA